MSGNIPGNTRDYISEVQHANRENSNRNLIILGVIIILVVVVILIFGC
jgi:hypothetical protein